jgi:uncharacterized protein (TIGR04551 family)
MMPGMPRPQPGGEEPRQEGPAEAAPDEEKAEAEDEPLGLYQEARRRSAQVLDLDGYFRFRTDWFRQLNLGLGYTNPDSPESGGLPPFPTPLECGTAAECKGKSMGGANMRLRLDPTINVTDQVRVNAQIDVLDNVIAGSTPDSLVSARRLGTGELSDGPNTANAPHPSLYTTQDPPQFGKNTFGSSIRARRAWGEVDSEFGSLRFGRMPWHFGRGMLFNNGNCLDCEGGTTVDRVMALASFYNHQVALSYDWGAQGPNLAQTTVGYLDLQDAPYDLSQEDDVFQLTASILRIDDVELFRARAGAGDFAVNYGFQLVYRSQSSAIYPSANTPNTPENGEAFTPEELANPEVFIKGIDAMVFLPDLWFKLGWKALTIEFESSAILGKIGNSGPLSEEADKELTLRQLGWVLASDLSLFKNTLHIGFETGGASGDQAENPNAYLNFRWKTVRQPVGDNILGDFKFSPEYHVDQILFRRLLGTITNAAYFKPQIAYWLGLAEGRQVGVTAAVIYSLALEPVSTPGNSLSYGIEMNLGLTYRNPRDGYYAGAVWGVLWPLGALERLQTNLATEGISRQDVDTAQVIRTFLGIQF